MRTSRKGIEFIKAHEGLRLDAYNVKMEWGYENNPILPKSYIFMKWLKDSNRDKHFKYAMKLSVPTTGLITIAMFILFKDIPFNATYVRVVGRLNAVNFVNIYGKVGEMDKLIELSPIYIASSPRDILVNTIDKRIEIKGGHFHSQKEGGRLPIGCCYL